MGCDIHMFVEARMRREVNEQREWMLVNKRLEVIGLDPEEPDAARATYHLWYPGRNYDAFAILADVRNGYGFAGVDTGEGFEPLSPPKGVPVDVSDPVQEVIDGWGIDGHSHSYLTLAELKADYEYWDQMTVKTGMVRKEQVPDDGGPPQGGYAGAVFGNNVDEFVSYSWGVTYREACNYIHQSLIPELERLLAFDGLNMLDHFDWRDREDRIGEDDIRIVFFFDN